MGKVRMELLSWLADTVEGAKDNPSAAYETETSDCHTLKDLLVRMAHAHPQFENRVFDSRTLLLNSAVAVFHNGKQIELKDGLQTSLKAGDSIVLVPIVAGG